MPPPPPPFATAAGAVAHARANATKANLSFMGRPPVRLVQALAPRAAGPRARFCDATAFGRLAFAALPLEQGGPEGGGHESERRGMGRGHFRGAGAGVGGAQLAGGAQANPA